MSSIIATLGLLENSTAVIIGAMLIAPLLSLITRSSIALVRGDLTRVWRALITLLIGILLAIGVSGVLGLLVSLTFFNTFEQLPSEIVSRTMPNLFDLIVALAGGAADAYALARPNITATLPGVAIATALMPPLCIVGIGVALGRMDLSIGALLLFLANLTGIVFASSLVFAMMGFRPKLGPEGHRFIIRRALLIEGIFCCSSWCRCSC